MVKLSTVISYCSLDRPFIDKTIENATVFSDEIILSTCTHLFSGVEEDLGYLAELKEKHPNLKFVISPYDPNTKESQRYWHCLERWNGYLASFNDHILFLDADEIPDGPMMKNYLADTDISGYDVVMFSCYWYFRQPVFRSTTEEFCGAIYKRSAITKELIFNDLERWGYIMPNFSHLTRLEHQKYNGQTIMHHFSWVRKKEDLIRKAINFGHANDRDWVSKIEEEFSHPFNGTDFVHGYNYAEVPNVFNIEV